MHETHKTFKTYETHKAYVAGKKRTSKLMHKIDEVLENTKRI